MAREIQAFYPDARPAQADKAYFAAVEKGEVAELCFLGGPTIEALRPLAPSLPGIGKDLCAVCAVSRKHREQCGGRPMKNEEARQKLLDQSPDVIKTDNDNAGALKVQRASMINALDRLTRGKRK